MKTTLQKLIEKWESETGSYIPNTPIYIAFIKEAKEFLEKEKQQIKRAFVAGYQARSVEDMIGGTGNEENEYYNSTFSDNTEAGI